MKSKVRIKICGITRVQDALYCAQNGVDALGFVFFANSKRNIAPENAQRIIKQLSPFITTVGLFVNETKENIEAILKTVPLNLLQFHGDETEDFCNGFNRPYLKAVRVKEYCDIITAVNRYPSAVALLFDAYHEENFGGTGLQFDWNLIPHDIEKPWVLAGGLNPQNIITAIKQTRALNVDVSSGVESEPGIKDFVKVKQFLLGARIATR